MSTFFLFFRVSNYLSQKANEGHKGLRKRHNCRNSLRSICVIDNGASRRRTRNARFRARRADHSTTCKHFFTELKQVRIKTTQKVFYLWQNGIAVASFSMLATGITALGETLSCAEIR